MTKIMKSAVSVALVFAFAVSVSACQTFGGPKQTGGTLVGAGLGALAGSQIGSGKGQIVATVIGALFGAWAGSEIGSSLDRVDEMYARQAAQTALERNQSGTPAEWRNPDSGHFGTVTPTRTFPPSPWGEYCREYLQEVWVGGQKVHAYGVACRRPDGSWLLNR